MLDYLWWCQWMTPSENWLEAVWGREIVAAEVPLRLSHLHGFNFRSGVTWHPDILDLRHLHTSSVNIPAGETLI